MRLRWCAEISIVKVYGFTTQVLLVSVWPVVTAHTGEAVTGVEALNLLGTNLVDVDLAEVDVVDRPHRLVQIRREQVGGEAVRGVVGKLDGLLEIVKRLDREHRTEHLALHDVHLVSRTREHRRFEPVPLLKLLPLRTRPTELQRYRYDVLRGGGQDLSPGAHRSGHGDHLGDGVAHQRVADHPPGAGKHVDDPRRHLSLLDYPGKRERRKRRV